MSKAIKESEFQCDSCGGVFEKGSDEEALQEMRDLEMAVRKVFESADACGVLNTNHKRVRLQVIVMNESGDGARTHCWLSADQTSAQRHRSAETARVKSDARNGYSRPRNASQRPLEKANPGMVRKISCLNYPSKQIPPKDLST